MNLKVKNFKNGNMEEILLLFKDVYGRELSKKYWIWRYHENLIQKKYIKLMWDEDKDILAGHYALFPVDLKIGSDIKKTGFSMTTMTSSQYGKLGVFSNLANSLYNDVYNELEIIWGFPNHNSKHGFVKHLGWQLLADIPMYELCVNILKEAKVNSYISHISSFSFDYDGFFEEVSQSCNIIIKKDAKYLNWRYVYNSENKYYIIEYRKQDQLMGFCVYKLYCNNNLLNGYIVDILSLVEGVFTSLIMASVQQLKTMCAQNVYIWMNDAFYLNALLNLGFQKTDRITHFGCRLNTENEFKTNIYNYNNWHLMMGDSDVF